MNKVYILLGSNMGDPEKKLLQAQKNIKKYIGKIIRLSSIYQTAAWGKTDQPDFLNQVIVVETKLSPQETIKTILSIEKEMGRIRTIKNAPRIIDIDILFYNKDLINHENLIVPHPEIQNRRFVLAPLNELSPNMKHPSLKKTIHYLLTICPDKLNVKKF
ncbi:MAG: 2-amino-4-hydroxy-6-hydroxymethyldihydropteridine diphosphokinase [Bacteroidota bacterium]